MVADLRASVCRSASTHSISCCRCSFVSLFLPVTVLCHLLLQSARNCSKSTGMIRQDPLPNRYASSRPSLICRQTVCGVTAKSFPTSATVRNGASSSVSVVNSFLPYVSCSLWGGSYLNHAINACKGPRLEKLRLFVACNAQRNTNA